MNFKTLATVCLATLTLAQLSTSAQANPGSGDYSIAQANSVSNRNASRTITDVMLFSQGMNRGETFKSDKGVADLSAVGFDDKAVAIQVNNGQKWRFYTDKNFQGEFIEIGPEEGRGFLGKFARKISSFKSVK